MSGEQNPERGASSERPDSGRKSRHLPYISAAWADALTSALPDVGTTQGTLNDVPDALAVLLTLHILQGTYGTHMRGRCGTQ
ncbi:Hypothetical predicted protein [Podarcis lilfordi]|uniref:Uncharacterized protein n=1 Tax=Podarcis lilfordi TaxID=74358 RepID=A0AA35LLJ5_9SAUR|nr:Hypothetical predicted protein [Podarcis lilfordi]